jgi:hypothetical protein
MPSLSSTRRSNRRLHFPPDEVGVSALTQTENELPSLRIISYRATTIGGNARNSTPFDAQTPIEFARGVTTAVATFQRENPNVVIEQIVIEKTFDSCDPHRNFTV